MLLLRTLFICKDKFALFMEGEKKRRGNLWGAYGEGGGVCGVLGREGGGGNMKYLRSIQYRVELALA